MKQTKYSRCAVVGCTDLYITFQPQKTQERNGLNSYLMVMFRKELAKVCWCAQATLNWTVLPIWANIHYRSKVWRHPDNFVFSMKTHTFIYQMSCKMNRKYSQDIDKVRNNDFSLKY